MTTVFESLVGEKPMVEGKARGIRYDYEILEGLSQRYAGEIKALPSGNQYVDWHSKVRVANEVFGPLGWSSTNVSPPTLIDNIGFMACKRVTVKYIDSVTNQVMEMHHEATGFCAIGSMKPEQALDTASKGSDSDALSKVFANFGDAFALFLWSGVRAPVQTATNAPNRAPAAAQRATTPQAAPRFSGGGSLATEGQQSMMVKLLVPRATAATVNKSLAMSADRDKNNGDLIGQLLTAKSNAGRTYSAATARGVLEANGVVWVEDGGDGMLDSYSEDEYPE